MSDDYENDELVTIKRSVLQCVLDTAASSMDAGSGFLDEEEVEALREAAVVLGVNPIAVTPDNHKCRYTSHQFCYVDTNLIPNFNKASFWYCTRCRKEQTTRPEAQDIRNDG